MASKKAQEQEPKKALSIDEIRSGIVANLEQKRVPASLGGFDIHVLTRTLRNTLEDVSADDEEGVDEATARGKKMMGFIFAPESGEPLFNPQDPDHVEMFLSLRQTEDMSKIFDIMSGTAVDEDPSGN